MKPANNTDLVSEIKSVVLRPKVPAKYQALMPAIVATTFSFVLKGVNVSIANSIRRAVGGEITVKRLTCKVEDITTNDVFILPEKVIIQFQSIPIMQTAKVGAVYTLRAQNDTTAVKKVHTASIQGTRAKSKEMPDGLCNDNILILDLQPGTYIEVPLTVVEGRTCVSTEGMAAVACLTSVVPLGVNMSLPYKVEGNRVVPDPTNGTSSLVADPREHLVTFTTNGTIPPAQIVESACRSLAARCQAVLDTRSDFRLVEGSDQEYIYELAESVTIGEIFMRAVLDTSPDVAHASYKEDTIGNVIVLRCKCEDIVQVVETAMRHAKEQFVSIGLVFAALDRPS